MAANTFLLTGPAASGKTQSLLERYRRALTELPPGAALWLAPTFRYAGLIREQLLGADLPGCFRPNVMTFGQFAEVVLRSADEPIRPVTALMKRQLLRTVVERAVVESQTPHFGAIAKSSGFLNLLESFISDLKRLEIWPERFAECCQQRDTRHLHELAWIYAEYQRLLTEHALYDAEGRFWSARDLLLKRPRRPFDQLQLVVADGFTDFTVTQYEILGILAQRADELHISLPLDPAAQREELFRKSADTLARLRQRLPNCRTSPHARSNAQGALAHLEQQLFIAPHEQTRVASGGRAVLIRAAGELREVEEIARQIKQMLLSAPERRPDDIVVVFRALGTSAELVREVFQRMGIPFAIECGVPLGRYASVTAMMGMLRLAIEGWPYRQVLATLGSAYYRPTGHDRLDRLAAAERLIHALQIPAGRDDLLQRIAYWAKHSPSEVAPGGAPDGELPSYQQEQLQFVQDAQRALPLLSELAERIDLLPQRATCAQWAAALERLAQAIGLGEVLQQHHDELGQQAWQRLLDALVQQERLERRLGNGPQVVERAEIYEWLSDMLARETLLPEMDEVGRVRVLAAASVRNLRVPYVFVAGLAETSFPQPHANRLYSDADAERLRARDLPLTGTGDSDHEEMLLFYEVVTRATERVWFSYPALDSAAQELLPSPYLAEVEQIIDFEPGDVIDATDPRPVYGIDRVPMCPPEWRTAATWKVAQGEVPLLARMLRDPERREAANKICEGLTSIQERAQRSFGRYDGLLGDPAALAWLAQKYGPEHTWSASRLENYASCPFQFFLGNVLKLRELPAIAVDLNPLERGSWLHNGLAKLHRDLLESKAGTFANWQAEQLLAQLQSCVKAERSRLADGTLLVTALREITQSILLRWCDQYYEQLHKYDSGHSKFDAAPVPSLFEVSFGMLSKSDDQHSTSEPLVLTQDGESVRISGRIDRVDIGTHAGQKYFNVIDYKSGRVPRTKADSVDGTALQLELYAMAVERVLFAEETIVPAGVGYWGVAKEGFKQTLTMCQVATEGLDVSPVWQDRSAQVSEKVIELVRGIRQGQFPVFSLDDQCTSRCAYATVCRVNQVRSLAKPWPDDPVRDAQSAKEQAP